MKIAVNARGAVDCRATLSIPLAAAQVWGQLRDFPRYARQDFFHAEMTIEGGVPRPGARLFFCHRFAGLHVGRVGRILIWREGIGFAFSDLSRCGPRRGFPHILSLRLEPVDAAASRLHLRVRGLWTARRIPRWIARIWLYWVFAHIARSIENQLLAYQIWLQERRPLPLISSQSRPPGYNPPPEHS